MNITIRKAIPAAALLTVSLAAAPAPSQAQAYWRYCHGVFGIDWDCVHRARQRAERRREEIRQEVRREEYREEERRRERHEQAEEDRCKAAIHAVGEADHLKEAAKRSAIHAFQAQVINLYGERFMDYESAKVLDEHFDLAGIGSDVITNTKRYVITARPCLRKNNMDGDSQEEVPAPR